MVNQSIIGLSKHLLCWYHIQLLQTGSACCLDPTPLHTDKRVLWRRTVVLTGAAQEDGRVQDTPTGVVRRRRSRVRWRGPLPPRRTPLPCTNK